nr:MAG: structural polyprotein [Dicistroviridae sp.]
MEKSDQGRADSSEPNQQHQDSTGTSDRTLIGDSTSRKYDDAVGFISEGRVLNTDMDQNQETVTLTADVHPDREQFHSIKRILSRPVKIATITFDSNATVGSTLGSYPIMSTFQKSSGFKLAREKLSTFYGVRWTAHLKVTLNAQPFEAGLFQIYFIPFDDLVYKPETGIPVQYTLPFTTGCPNVMCNLSLQSEIELSVPYTGPVPFINLTNSTPQFGTFYIQSIVPITDATNAPSCELSVYMFFSEIDMFGVTPNNVIANPQMLGKMQQKESKAKTHGPLTTIGNTLLPILDSLGLSAPVVNLNPERRLINPYASPSTADTTKSPIKVAYLSTQAIEISSLGVDAADECDIGHIISKPTYYDQFKWATTDTELTLLNTYPIEPNCQGATFRNQIINTPNRLRYMANVFRLWRGTIRYTFTVVANKFHSGRLRLVYTLGGPVNASADLLNVYPRTFSQVIDIRDGSTFQVDCEFFASTPWRVIPQAFLTTANRYIAVENYGYLQDSPAFLQIYVENELRAASTTAQSISIIAQVSAGPDFEFSVPVAPKSFPFTSLPLPSSGNQPAQNEVADPQMLTCQSISMIGEDAGDSRKMPHPMTTGERIENVRTLLRRYQLIGSGTVDFSNSVSADFVLFPYQRERAIGLTTFPVEMYSYFMYLYAFYRGSLRYLLVTNKTDIQWTFRYNPDILDLYQPEVSDTNTEFGDKVPIKSITSFPAGSTFDSYPMTGVIPYNTNLQGGAEIEFPYYSRFHKAICKQTITSAASYYRNVEAGGIPQGYCIFQMQSPSKNSDTFTKTYRTVGDDFNLGYLLGAPITVSNILPN